MGNTPELKFSEQGSVRCHFSVFVTEFHKSLATNERITKTIIYECTAFGVMAEQAVKILRKGMWVFCTGRMHSRKVKDKTYWNLTLDTMIRLPHQQNKMTPRADEGDEDNETA